MVWCFLVLFWMIGSCGVFLWCVGSLFGGFGVDFGFL